MTDGTRWPANIAGQPWAHVTDVSATKKTPQTHGIAAYRSLHSNPTPPLHQGLGVPGVVRGHHIGLLALLRSSRAHNSLLSICRARHAPDVRGMQQADVMVKRSNA